MCVCVCWCHWQFTTNIGVLYICNNNNNNNNNNNGATCTVNFKSLGTSRFKVKRKMRGNGIYRKHYLYGGGAALYTRVVLSRSTS